VDPGLFAAFRRKIAPRTRGQLAPLKVIDCIEAACTRPKEEALRFERECFLECRDSAQRQALMHLFRAERAARRVPGVPADLAPAPIRSAGVVGAGTMGGGIAMCFANAGIGVAVLESSAAALEKGLAAIRRNYDASVARGSLSAERAAAALALIRGVSDYQTLGGADIVIEAVFEELQVKQEVFARLDSVAAPHAILATNTSTLDIDAIAASTARPAQVVGTHFFSPAHVMRLLENVRGRATSAHTIATVMELGKQLGKVPVLAGNCDGFIGNRMLMYYGAEAEYLLEQGATPEQIDRVMEEFGFAMGPLAVRDLAGNDVGWRIRKARRLPADERWSPILERLVAAGRLGQKSGRGYYRYEGRTRIPDPQVIELIEGVSRELGIRRRSIPDEEILASLLHPLVNEGARILEEGIALRAGDIDLVYVHGYGFPAWRGGPMYWGERAGIARVVDTMRRLSARNGARWRPARLLEQVAATGCGWDNAAGNDATNTTSNSA
jgi:3-hydroxyacyl-CoA dehydrogenase